jgi:hypothetical protein
MGSTTSTRKGISFIKISFARRQALPKHGLRRTFQS